MYVDSLEINNFRCFDHTSIDLQYQKLRPTPNTPKLSNINLLLGDNGTGKSAFLRALTLAILGRIVQSSGYRPYFLVRRFGTETEQQTDAKKRLNADVRAKLILHSQDEEGSIAPWSNRLPGKVTGQATVTRTGDIETISSVAHVNPQRWNPLFDDHSPAFFLAAYGANRRVEASETFDTSARNRTFAPRFQRVASLFYETSSLVPTNICWSELRSKERHEEGLELINALLPEEVRVEASKLPDTDIIFLYRGTALPFSELSDGYRSFISWVVDLLYQMSQVTSKGIALTQLRGVVIVDELDLLLHPAWQRTVVESLGHTFPELQFFFTTHSPIVTGTLEAANILITEFDIETRSATITKGQERIHGLSADQILDSEYFGLDSSRAPDMEDHLQGLAERAWENDEKATLEYLHLLANGADSVAKATG